MQLTPTALIEAFHLAFLRALLRGIPSTKLAVKGGCNIRFFFGSPRYSEDIGLDVAGIPVFELRDKVVRILQGGALSSTLRPLGVERLVPPDMARAKQTETVQRFKLHLITSAGIDIATKIEFSRRGLDSPVEAEAVSPVVTGAYKLASLIAPHYGTAPAVKQKIRALADRGRPEPRDVFDLFVLAPFAQAEAYVPGDDFRRSTLEEARSRAFDIGYDRYRDEVVTFLSAEDQPAYDSPEMWDEIRLVAIGLLERGLGDET